MTDLSSKQKSLVSFMHKGPLHLAEGFSLIVKSPDPKAYFGELKAEGFFEPASNRGPEASGSEGYLRSPYWPALDYLKLLAGMSRTSDDAALGEKLMQIVRSVSGRRDAEGNFIDNFYTQAAFAEIMGLVPARCIKVSDLDFISEWLRSGWGNSSLIPELDKHLFPSLIEEATRGDPSKIVTLLRICTELKPIDGSTDQARSELSVAEAYWLEQLLSHHAADLGAVAQEGAVQCLVGRTREVFSSDKFISRNTWLHRPAIEKHSQNHGWHRVPNALVDATRDSIDAWLGSSAAKASAYVASLLGDEAEIIRRIAIHTVRVRWNLLGDRLEAQISPSLFQFGHLHELYLLLQERYRDFSEGAKAASREAIASLVAGSGSAKEQERSRSIQRNWLDAMKGHGDTEVDVEYQRLTAELGPIREHPDFISYSTFSVGTGPSPYTKDEIKAFANEGELVDRVDTFVPPQDERQSSRKSLIDAVSDAVAEEPEAFLPYLKPELVMSRRLQYGLLEGFQRYLESSKDATNKEVVRRILDALLPYVANLLSDQRFWSEEVADNQEWEPTRDWIPSVAASLVKKAASNASAEISDADAVLLLEVANLVVQHSEGIEGTQDPMTAAINNPRGEAFESVLQLLLRRCRDLDAATGGHEPAWAMIRPFIEREIERKDVGLEVSTLLGAYFAQLLYVDEAWTIRNLSLIFSETDVDNFVCAIAGLAYTASSGRVYKALQSGNVIERALRTSGLKESARERLIERVALAYMWGLETLESPVVAGMLNPERQADIVEMASTLARWADNEELDAVQIRRAKAFAAKCVDLEVHDADIKRQLLGAISGFIDYARPATDDDLAWLLKVADYAHDTHNQYQFAESIDRLADSSPAHAAKVLAAFIERRQPQYDYKESLESAIRKIYGAGLRHEAIAAVEVLLTKGGLRSMVQLYSDLKPEN